MMLAILSPLPQFFDADGSPLDGGRLFFGVANQNPETSPVTVYWDEAGTQPAAQPIRTRAGYPVRNGTPSLVYVGVSYSLLVRNSAGAQLLYARNSADFGNAESIAAQFTALADTSDPLKGPALVGFNPTLAYAANTVGWALRTPSAGAVSILRYIPPSEWAAIAAGTSTTNVASYITTALNSGAPEVFFPCLAFPTQSKYRVTSKITRPPGVSMRGANSFYTAIEAAHNDVIIECTPATLSGDAYAGIFDMSIRNASGFASSIGVSIANMNQTAMERVRIEGGPLICLQLVFALNSRFSRLTLLDAPTVGLYIYSTGLATGNNGNTYDDINITYCDKGIRIDAGGTILSQFRNVKIEGCTNFPVELIAGTNFVFEGLYLEGNATNMLLSGGSDIKFRDCTNVSVQQWINTAGFAAARVTVENLNDLSAGGILNHPQVEIISFGQLKFPATQVASANPNTLDDYEEGTWTISDSSGAGLTFTSVSARYTKIGREVTAYFSLTLPVTASSVDFAIGGLPFTSVGNGIVSIGYTTESTLARGETFDAQNIVQLYNATGTKLTNANLSGDTIRGVITYSAAT